MIVVQRECDLETIRCSQFQYQARIDFLLFQSPIFQPLHDTQRPAWKTFIQRGLQHARQGHHQSRQNLDWQDDAVVDAVTISEAEANLCPTRLHAPGR